MIIDCLSLRQWKSIKNYMKVGYSLPEAATMSGASTPDAYAMFYYEMEFEEDENKTKQTNNPAAD